jgi:hypothetical protein
MKPVHLLVGVPGSGKSWVAKQIKDAYNYVQHDTCPVNQYAHLLQRESQDRDGNKPILAEAPFRASILLEELRYLGVPVKTYHLNETEPKVRVRYEMREGHPIPKQHITNLHKYAKRQWDNSGTSEEILAKLKGSSGSETT